MQSRSRTVLAAGILAGAVLLTSACGVSRPSVGDLEKGLTKAGTSLTKTQIDCLAKVMHDSKVSDKALKAVADNAAQAYKTTDADNQALKDVAAPLQKCVATQPLK